MQKSEDPEESINSDKSSSREANPKKMYSNEKGQKMAEFMGDRRKKMAEMMKERVSEKRKRFEKARRAKYDNEL